MERLDCGYDKILLNDQNLRESKYKSDKNKLHKKKRSIWNRIFCGTMCSAGIEERQSMTQEVQVAIQKIDSQTINYELVNRKQALIPPAP